MTEPFGACGEWGSKLLLAGIFSTLCTPWTEKKITFNCRVDSFKLSHYLVTFSRLVEITNLVTSDVFR